MSLTRQQVKEMEDIVARRIPLGQVLSKCHAGICTIDKCSRCQDAAKIHAFFDELMINEVRE